MTQDRLIVAIGRMERALSRIESTTKQDGDSALAERHARLREEAGKAVEAIDRLLAKGAL